MLAIDSNQGDSIFVAVCTFVSRIPQELIWIFTKKMENGQITDQRKAD